jgi:hypothetical protein
MAYRSKDFEQVVKVEIIALRVNPHGRSGIGFP